MTVFLVGGLNDIEKLPFRQTRDYRIDNCPHREVVRDLEKPQEREQRIRKKVKEQK